MVKIAAIGGSLRSGSSTYLALQQAVDRLTALGAEVTLLDLRTMNLPFCDGGDDYSGYPDVKRLQEVVKEADAIVLASPEYHGSVSGVLKNALDLMGFEEMAGKVTGIISVLASPEYHGSVSGVLKNALDLMGFEEMAGKVTGLISVLGGQANSNALNDLRLIMRWVNAWVIPEQIGIAQAWKAFGDDGKLLDEKLAERFDRFAQSLVDNTRKIRGVN